MARHGGFPGMGMGNMQQLARQAQMLQQQFGVRLSAWQSRVPAENGAR